PIKADFGMEGLELEWKAGGVLRDVLTQFGALKHDAVGLRFAAALQADDSEEIQALEVVVRGRHTEIDHGKAKAGDKTEFTVKSALSYYKLSIDNEVLIEIDLVNMIEIVNGTDRMQAVRSALGV
ncbi:phage major tail tube protein, partial [Streptomyces sp. G35A]